MKFKLQLIAIIAFLFISCKQNNSTKETVQAEVEKGDIVKTIIEDEGNFYYIDFNTYPSNDASLP
ncbi:MAG: hypothetical protein ABFR32_12740, partial [Bacteroidota bacterium]